MMFKLTEEKPPFTGLVFKSEKEAKIEQVFFRFKTCWLFNNDFGSQHD